MALAAGTRLGPYEVVAALGAGGMGEVYQARDTRLDRTVAIKVLPSELSTDPERRARFEREARTIAALNHPHICTLHDVGEAELPASDLGRADFQVRRPERVTYLVMENLVGETLAQRLRKGALPIAQALDIGAQIADALDAAHKQGVVHRDLKPSNVMLTTSGAGRSGVAAVKLLDPPLASGGCRPAEAYRWRSRPSTVLQGNRATSNRPSWPGAGACCSRPFAVSRSGDLVYVPDRFVGGTALGPVGYGVAPDGQHFYFLQAPDDAPTGPVVGPPNVVLAWHREIAARMGAR